MVMRKKRRGRSAAFMRSINPHLKKRRVSRKRVSMAKKKRRSARRGIVGGLQRPLIAGITYGVAQPFVSQFLSRFNIGVQDELVQIISAVVLKNVIKNRIVSAYADAAIIVNTASLSRSVAGRFNVAGVSKSNGATAPTMQVIG